MIHSDREGVGIIEVLVVLVLVLGLSALMVSFTARQRRVQEDLAVLLETSASVRVTRHVLRREASVVLASRDMPAAGGDSLILRVFRGIAVPCATTSGVSIVVAAEGMRLPDPAKDSVLALSQAGRWTTLALEDAVDAESPSCVAPGTVQRWTLSGSMEGPPALLRYFERGSYHLSGGAFRYRRGNGGRQPLTGVVFSPSNSGFQRDALGVAVELDEGAGAAPWRFRLPGSER